MAIGWLPMSTLRHEVRTHYYYTTAINNIIMIMIMIMIMMIVMMMMTIIIIVLLLNGNWLLMSRLRHEVRTDRRVATT